MPRLSIVMSVHDKAPYLGEFLDNLRQTEPEAELVVVDDGSSDGTTDIARAKADVFLRTENVWEVKANNVGLKAATGDHIAIVQDDDFILPRLWASTAAAAMLAHDLGILGCRGYGHVMHRAQAEQMQARAAEIERQIMATGEMRPEDNGRNFCRLTEANGIAYGKVDIHLRNFAINPYQAPDGGPATVICAPAPIYLTDVTIRSPFIIDRRVIQTIGVMDEAYAPLNMDDHDFCMRARKAGFRVGFSRVPSINRFRGGSRWLYAGAQEGQRSHVMNDSFVRNSQRFYGDWLQTAGDIFALERLGAIQFQPSLLSFDAVQAESATVARLFNISPERALD